MRRATTSRVESLRKATSTTTTWPLLLCTTAPSTSALSVLNRTLEGCKTVCRQWHPKTVSRKKISCVASACQMSWDLERPCVSNMVTSLSIGSACTVALSHCSSAREAL